MQCLCSAYTLCMPCLCSAGAVPMPMPMPMPMPLPMRCMCSAARLRHDRLDVLARVCELLGRRAEDGALGQLVRRLGQRPVLVRGAVAGERRQPPAWPKAAGIGSAGSGAQAIEHHPLGQPKERRRRLPFDIQAARALLSGPEGSPARAGGPTELWSAGAVVSRMGGCVRGHFDPCCGTAARQRCTPRRARPGDLE